MVDLLPLSVSSRISLEFSALGERPTMRWKVATHVPADVINDLNQDLFRIELFCWIFSILFNVSANTLSREATWDASLSAWRAKFPKLLSGVSRVQASSATVLLIVPQCGS